MALNREYDQSGNAESPSFRHYGAHVFDPGRIFQARLDRSQRYALLLDFDDLIDAPLKHESRAGSISAIRRAKPVVVGKIRRAYLQHIFGWIDAPADIGEWRPDFIWSPPGNPARL